MNVPLDEVVYFDAITSDPDTGAAGDADAAPSFAVYEEATDTDVGVGGNMTKRTSLDGNYRGTFTASAANGFEVGKWYSVIATAVVGGVTGKAVLLNFRCTAAEVSAGKMPITIAAGDIATDAITAAAVKADAVTKIQAGLSTYDGSDTSGTTQLLADLATVAGYIDTEIGDIVTALTAIKGATFDTATDSLEAVRNRGDAAWITATGFSTLDAAGVRTALGMSAANLDTQLGDIPTVSEFNNRTLLAASYATQTTLLAVGGIITGISATSDKLDTMLVLDGAVYQFTANALELGPAGGAGSGDATEAKQDSILLLLQSR